MDAKFEDTPLLKAAELIVDGTPVDWQQVQQQATGDEAAVVLDQLAVLQRIVDFHNQLPGADGAGVPTTADRTAKPSWSRFTIVGEIGRGSFGTVYRATDPDLHREVALKVVEGNDQTAGIDPTRAVAEGRLLARVRHANVVTVYGAERDGNTVALWMEYINGHTFDELVRRQGPFSAREATLVGLDLCRALAAVHAAGLIHGDIKAHNVMREAGGRTVLMDFGTGRDLHQRSGGTGDDFAGTPLYLPPEVFAGAERSAASDLYGLGVLLYFLATGSYPVPGDTRTAVERHHQSPLPPTHLRDARPDLPERFIQVVERAIAQNPEQRFRTSGEFESALNQALGSEHPQNPGRQVTRWTASSIASLVFVATLVTSGIFWFRPALLSKVKSIAAGSEAAGAGAYQVEAGVYRVQPGGAARLTPNATVNPGDQLFVRLQVSVPASLYVVDEDDQGESYLLFPMPGLAAGNPLSPGKSYDLPGAQNGQPIHWRVTSAGGREHILVFISPDPMPILEKTFATLPHPTPEKPVLSARLPFEAVEQLRAIGGVATATRPAQQASLTAQFTAPLADTAETVRGLFARQITFQNSMP